RAWATTRGGDRSSWRLIAEQAHSGLRLRETGRKSQGREDSWRAGEVHECRAGSLPGEVAGSTPVFRSNSKGPVAECGRALLILALGDCHDSGLLLAVAWLEAPREIERRTRTGK